MREPSPLLRSSAATLSDRVLVKVVIDDSEDTDEGDTAHLARHHGRGRGALRWVDEPDVAVGALAHTDVGGVNHSSDLVSLGWLRPGS